MPFDPTAADRITEEHVNDALEDAGLLGAGAKWLDHDDDCMLNLSGPTPFRKVCDCHGKRIARLTEALDKRSDRVEELEGELVKMNRQRLAFLEAMQEAVERLSPADADAVRETYRWALREAPPTE